MIPYIYRPINVCRPPILKYSINLPSGKCFMFCGENSSRGRVTEKECSNGHFREGGQVLKTNTVMYNDDTSFGTPFMY